VRRFDAFRERLAECADLPCLFTEGSWSSYADLRTAVDIWTGRVEALRLPAGSVVGLQSDYSLDAVALLLALCARGVVSALIPQGPEGDGYLRDALASGVFVVSSDGTYRWESRTPASSHPLLEHIRTAGDAGLVIFTSGSSGRPKAALHSLERFLHKFQKPGRRFHTLAFLLFDHIAGLDTLFYTLSNGGALIFTRARDPRSICALIAQARVEVLPASPSFLRLLCASGEATDHDLSSLRIVTYGSEPMDPATLARLNELFPNARISQKYGTTETGAPRTVSRGNDSLWLQLRGDGLETRIVEGVLWIRSEGALLGYLNAPSPVNDDGWYCTGDLAEQDGDWIHILGRASDLINVGGEKVSPVEVEQVILELDFVAAAAVSGTRHPLLGQIVTATVSLCTAKDPRQVEKRIRAHCRERLPRYKVPVTVDVVDAALTSGRQKVLRQRD